MIARLVVGIVVLLLFTVPPSVCLWCVVQARDAAARTEAAANVLSQLRSAQRARLVELEEGQGFSPGGSVS